MAKRRTPKRRTVPSERILKPVKHDWSVRPVIVTETTDLSTGRLRVWVAQAIDERLAQVAEGCTTQRLLEELDNLRKTDAYLAAGW